MGKLWDKDKVHKEQTNCIWLLLYRVGKYIKKVTKVAEIVGNYLLFILGNKDQVLVCCEDDEALPFTLATKRML